MADTGYPGYSRYKTKNLHPFDDKLSDSCGCVDHAAAQEHDAAPTMCIRNFKLTFPCTIEDLLPTMEETRQPSKCPAALFCSPGLKHGTVAVDISPYHAGWHAPRAVLEESDNYTEFELTVIAQTERFKDESKYPTLSRNGNVAAATATW